MRPIKRELFLAGLLTLPGSFLSVAQEADTPELALQDLESIPIIREADVSLYFGLEYSEGDYGDIENTHIAYAPLSVRYAKGAWSFRASTGFIRIEGDDNFIPGTGLAAVANDMDADSRGATYGMGDLFLSGTYSVQNPPFNDVFLDVTARLKLPTGSVDKGFSTGKTDLSLQLDVAKLMGNLLPFATVGYRYVGKTDRFRLQDTWYMSVGASYFLTYDLSMGLSYDLRRSATVDTANPEELLAFIDYQYSANWGLYVYGTLGLSDSSPDGGAGLQLRYNF